MATKMSELIEKYQKYVVQNRDVVGYIENAVRCLSYLVAVRIEDSAVLSELLYTASKLLTLINDFILRKAANIKTHVPVAQEKIRQWLTVLEYVGVLLEITSLRYLKQKGRWVVITCIELVRSILRLILLIKHSSGIQPGQLISSLNRERDLGGKFISQHSSQNAPNGEAQTFRPPRITFSLKHSGRKVRTLEAAPPINMRTWSLPPSEASFLSEVMTPTQLNQQKHIAEVLHISRPLIHLLTMYATGVHSWKPWLLSCVVDVLSLKLFGDKESYHPAEREELRRRTMMLILYVLRSPFYDRYGKTQVLNLMRFIAYVVPGASLITGPLLDYLPEWQKTYFYVWAN